MDEIQIIMEVLERDDRLRRDEEQRLEQLRSRLTKQMNCLVGDGRNECLLCGEKYQWYACFMRTLCLCCQNVTCTRCSVSAVAVFTNLKNGKENFMGQRRVCRLCNDRISFYKKSGIWRYDMANKISRNIDKILVFCVH
ncbi:hypothetical protein ACOME3_007081 [Neoechinorhynchus agilis]